MFTPPLYRLASALLPDITPPSPPSPKPNRATYGGDRLPSGLAVDHKNTYHHTTGLQTNASKMHLLSLSGAKSQAMMLNNAQFHTNNVFKRPIVLNWNQHPSSFGFILLLLTSILVLFIVSGLVICSRRRQLSRRKREQSSSTQHRLVNNDRTQQHCHRNPTYPPADKPTNSSINELISNYRNIKNKKQIRDEPQQRVTDLLKENDRYKKGVKQHEYCNTKGATNVIDLPEQDDMLTIESSSPIYDVPPVHSTSQWAHDELLKHMQI